MVIPSFRDSGVMVSYGRLLVPDDLCFFAPEASPSPGESLEYKFGAKRNWGVGNGPIPDVKRPFRVPALCHPCGIKEEES